MREDEYEGYRIPAHSIVLGNAWCVLLIDVPGTIRQYHFCRRAMLHNEADYPNPELFRPERFLKEGKLNNDVRDPIAISFGFGRRYDGLLPCSSFGAQTSKYQSMPRKPHCPFYCLAHNSVDLVGIHDHEACG
jgi:hypothetical protein